MDKKYDPNKVPKESRIDARYPGTSHNERYLNTQDAGSMNGGVFGHADKVMQVDPCPNYDIGRMQYSPFQNRGTPMEAFKYDF